MREYERLFAAVEADFTLHALFACAQANRPALVLARAGHALRQHIEAKITAPQLDASRERSAIEQPAPQAGVAATRKRLPQGINCFHADGDCTLPLSPTCGLH